MYLPGGEDRYIRRQINASYYFGQKFLEFFETRYPTEFKSFLEKNEHARAAYKQLRSEWSSEIRSKAVADFYIRCQHLMDFETRYKYWVKHYVKGGIVGFR